MRTGLLLQEDDSCPTHCELWGLPKSQLNPVMDMFTVSSKDSVNNRHV